MCKGTRMYLVKRKRDGKYWRNRSFYTRILRAEEENWTYNTQDCRPHTSKSGAKNAMHASGWEEIPLGTVKVPIEKIYKQGNSFVSEWTYKRQKYMYYKTNSEDILKKWVDHFDEKYEIVEINIGTLAK